MGLSEDQKDWAFLLWQQGQTQLTIARRLSVSVAAISNLKKTRNWEGKGRTFQPSYHDIINNGLRFVGRLQMELERGRFVEKGRPRDPLSPDEINSHVKNIKYTADTIMSIEKLCLEVDTRNQMLTLEKHMEWVKKRFPDELKSLELAQGHYDELNGTLG